MLDHLFATIPPSVICYYIPQYGLLPQLPAGITADRKGRRSSDVTVDYIRTLETPTIVFFTLETETGYHAMRARILLEKKLTRGFSSILPTGQKTQRVKLARIGRLAGFTLLIEDVDLTRNQAKPTEVFQGDKIFLFVFVPVDC
ncbi:hypothetical protein CHARACLAT_000129 [Characodon lateralis]|uniref:Uncharacterized protein n=1 Tax=Characodon lateralis TaxID=208331 RepID=A0ABU7CLM6_9TELE|nr:hypothetical protein [Characodon lateralis]